MRAARPGPGQFQARASPSTASVIGPSLRPQEAETGAYYKVIISRAYNIRRHYDCIWARVQQIANHELLETTKLYDRTEDQITLDEVERIVT
jgi:hypothetical protein